MSFTIPVLTKKCIFCGINNTTKEHVFSKWTHKFMPPRRKGRTPILRGTKYFNRDNRKVGQLPGDVRDWQVKCVCGGDKLSCNNGWMRRIEDDARPILARLFVGDESRITPIQQQKIATWAALKCMVSEYAANGHVTTHHSQRRRMFLNHLPPANDWGIWIGSVERKGPPYPSWSSVAFHIAPRAKLISNIGKPLPRYNSHSTSIIINKLLIQVIRLPEPRFIKTWKFDLPDKGALFCIWPRTHFSINWPARDLTFREVERTMDAMDTYLTLLVRKNPIFPTPHLSC